MKQARMSHGTYHHYGYVDDNTQFRGILFKAPFKLTSTD